MNWIDIAIVILLFYLMATGYRKGFARSLLDLAGIVLVVVVSLTQFDAVSDFLGDAEGTVSGWLPWISLFACLGISLVLVNVIIGVAGRPFRGSSKSLFSRLTGFLLGGARGCVIVSLLLILLAFMPFTDSARAQVHRSSLAPGMMRIIPDVIDTVTDRVGPGSPPILEKLERYLRAAHRTEGRPVDNRSAHRFHVWLSLSDFDPENP